MVWKTDRQFFLGHHKSIEDPEGHMIDEVQHVKGAFVGIFQSMCHYSYEEYFVVTRNNRRVSTVDIVQPRYYPYQSNGEFKHADELFIDDWEYQHGFGENLEAAKRYLAHIIADENHPAISTPYKSNRVRDAQREKVYTWELHFYEKPTNSLTKEECRLLVRKIESDFAGLTKRDISLTFYERGGCFQRGFSEVNLAKYGRNRDTVVHEMAHWVVSNLHKRNVAGHGAEFMGIFMLMLQAYQGCSLPDMVNKAVEMKIKFVFPDGGLDGLFERLRLDCLAAA